MDRVFRILAVVLVLGLGTTGCDLFGGDDETEGGTGTVPEVVASHPEDGDEQIGTWSDIYVAFNTDLDTTTVAGAITFESASKAPVSFDIEWDPLFTDRFEINAHDQLAENTLYTVTIGTDLKSAGGANMAAEWSITYRTETAWPVVVETLPADGAEGVPLNAVVHVEFSREMNPTSVSDAFSIVPAVDWTPSHDEEDYTFTFDAPLAASTLYTVTISTDAVSAYSSTPLPADHVFTFTTGTEADNEPPTIVSYSPADGATGVSPGIGQLSITFSEPVDIETIAFGEIDVRLMWQIEMFMMGEPEVVGNTLYLDIGVLPPGTELFMEIAHFEDLAGNAAITSPTWNFTTSGTADWFPSSAGDWWRYWATDDMYDWDYLAKVEGISGTDFTIAEYEPDYRSAQPRDWGPDDFTELQEMNYYRKLSNAIQMRGFGEDYDGTWVNSMFDAPVDWLPLPPTAGTEWSGTITMGDTIRILYEAEIVAREDVYPGFGLRGMTPRFEKTARFLANDRQPPGIMVFPDCAVTVLDFTMQEEVEGEWETFQAGTDSTWYCSGVGMIHQHSIGEDYGDESDDWEDWTYLDWWWIGQD